MILRPQKLPRRGELTQQQWNRLQPLLPPEKPHTGCPSKDHRTVINGMLWILRTGAPWRDLPRRYGAWQTVSGRFYHWRRIGLVQEILQTLQQQADAEGKLKSADSSRRWQCCSRSPTCSWGKKGELNAHSDRSAIEQVQQREALGWSKGGFSTKVHLRCDGNGLPITFLLTVGERHEAVVFESLMTQGSVKRPGAGRPRLRPLRVVGDKGYSSGSIRRYLRRRGIRLTIPRKDNERRRGKARQVTLPPTEPS